MEIDLSQPIDPNAGDVDYQLRRRLAIRREQQRWAHPWPCTVCGEWVGHFGGSVDRAPCNCIPLNVPLEEVRPNCFTVRRYWMGDAIRAALDKRAGG